MANAELAQRIVQQLLDCGVKEVCSCAGSRNAPLCMTLNQVPGLKVYNWPEERSAAFFALGRSKFTGLPVPIVVTSGTAAAELLPAAVEAFYSGVPIILLTADRPREYRNTGAPQSAEQVGLFSHYTKFNLDIANDEPFDLSQWDQRGPCHINACFEEPQSQPLFLKDANFSLKHLHPRKPLVGDPKVLQDFLSSKQSPLVIVGSLKQIDQQQVKKFLLQLDCPLFLEAHSGLREDPDLQERRVHFPDKLHPRAKDNGYEIDGVLRIGCVPTLRFWRDLEIIKSIPVLSINDVPFPGLTMGKIVTTDIAPYLEKVTGKFSFTKSSSWIVAENEIQSDLDHLCKDEPLAEAALIRTLSEKIPEGSNIFLGNSLPIREWDLTATLKAKNFTLFTNRGCNGIDGQLSAGIGLSDVNKENWIIVGDLTALYDLVAPWALQHIENLKLNIVVINNGGAKFFGKLFPLPELQNCHNFHFEGFAKQWKFDYERWDNIGECGQKYNRMIEIIPDELSTERFNKELQNLVNNIKAVSS